MRSILIAPLPIRRRVMANETPLMIEDLFGTPPSPTALTALAAAFALALIGTIKICSTYDGVSVPVWLIFNWLFPVIGPLIVLIYSPAPEGVRAEKSLWREFLTEEPHRKYLEKGEQTEAFQTWRKSQESKA